MQRLADTFSRVVFYPQLASSAVVIGFGLPLLRLYGAGFGDGYPSLVLLIFAHLANGTTGPVMNLLMLTGHERLTARVFVASTAAAVLIHAALIPLWGGTGAATGTLVSAVLWNGWLYFLVKRLLGVRCWLFTRSVWSGSEGPGDGSRKRRRN